MLARSAGRRRNATRVPSPPRAQPRARAARARAAPAAPHGSSRLPRIPRPPPVRRLLTLLIAVPTRITTVASKGVRVWSSCTAYDCVRIPTPTQSSRAAASPDLQRVRTRHPCRPTHWPAPNEGPSRPARGRGTIEVSARPPARQDRHSPSRRLVPQSVHADSSIGGVQQRAGECQVRRKRRHDRTSGGGQPCQESGEGPRELA